MFGDPSGRMQYTGEVRKRHNVINCSIIIAKMLINTVPRLMVKMAINLKQAINWYYILDIFQFTIMCVKGIQYSLNVLPQHLCGSLCLYILYIRTETYWVSSSLQ